MLRAIGLAVVILAVIGGSGAAATDTSDENSTPISTAAAYESWVQWYQARPTAAPDISGPRYRQLLSAADGEIYFLRGVIDPCWQVRELSTQALNQSAAHHNHAKSVTGVDSVHGNPPMQSVVPQICAVEAGRSDLWTQWPAANDIDFESTMLPAPARDICCAYTPTRDYNRAGEEMLSLQPIFALAANVQLPDLMDPTTADSSSSDTLDAIARAACALGRYLADVDARSANNWPHGVNQWGGKVLFGDPPAGPTLSMVLNRAIEASPNRPGLPVASTWLQRAKAEWQRSPKAEKVNFQMSASR